MNLVVNNTAIPLLEAKNLGYSLTHNQQQLHLIQELNFKLYAGEKVALVGASGSGKSSLLMLLAGLLEPTQGKVLWQGQEFSSCSEDERAAIRAQGLALVFQTFQLLPELTALENVLLPLELQQAQATRQLSLAQARELAAYWLEKVGLTARAKHRPNQLSGGEQQRVALARAFAMQPLLLLADEPTGNLDSRTGEQVAELMFELNSQQQETALVLVTHDLQLAKQCQSLYTLEAGRLQEGRLQTEITPESAQIKTGLSHAD